VGILKPVSCGRWTFRRSSFRISHIRPSMTPKASAASTVIRWKTITMIQVLLSSAQGATLPRKKLPNRCCVALTDQWACLIASLCFPLCSETLVEARGERGWRDIAVAILATSACGYGQCGNNNDESLHLAVVHLHNAKSFSRRPRPRPDRGRLWSGKAGIMIINPLTDRYGPATQVPIEKRVGRGRLRPEAPRTRNDLGNDLA
jgi:hypothetical protein